MAEEDRFSKRMLPKGPGMRHRAQSSDAGIPRRREESFLFPMMLLTLAKEPTDDATHNSAGGDRRESVAASIDDALYGVAGGRRINELARGRGT